MLVGSVLTAMGVAVDVGEAPAGQKGNTFLVSSTAGIFGFAATAVVATLSGPALVVGTGAALAGYFVNKSVKALGQLTFHITN